MGVWSSSGPHCGSRCRLARLAAVESVGFQVIGPLSLVRLIGGRGGAPLRRRAHRCGWRVLLTKGRGGCVECLYATSQRRRMAQRSAVVKRVPKRHLQAHQPYGASHMQASKTNL